MDRFVCNDQQRDVLRGLGAANPEADVEEACVKGRLSIDRLTVALLVLNVLGWGYVVKVGYDALQFMEDVKEMQIQEEFDRQKLQDKPTIPRRRTPIDAREDFFQQYRTEVV